MTSSVNWIQKQTCHLYCEIKYFKLNVSKRNSKSQSLLTWSLPILSYQGTPPFTQYLKVKFIHFCYTHISSAGLISRTYHDIYNFLNLISTFSIAIVSVQAAESIVWITDQPPIFLSTVLCVCVRLLTIYHLHNSQKYIL